MDNKRGSSERKGEGFKTCWVRSYYVDRRETSSVRGEDGTSFQGSENGAVITDCFRGQQYVREKSPEYGKDRRSYRERNPGYGKDRRSYRERSPWYGKDRSRYRERSPGNGKDRSICRDKSPGYGKDKRSYRDRSRSYGKDRGSYRVEEGRRGRTVLKNTGEMQEEKSRPRKQHEKRKRRLSKDRVSDVEFKMVHVEDKLEDINQDIQTPPNMTSGKDEQVITLYPSGKDERMITIYPSGKDERGEMQEEKSRPKKQPTKRKRRLSKNRVPDVEFKMVHVEETAEVIIPDIQTPTNKTSGKDERVITLYSSGKDERVITIYPSGKDERVVTLFPSDTVKRIIMSLNMKEEEVEETKMVIRTLQEQRRKVEEKENECQEEIVKVKQIIKNLWDEAKRTRNVDNYV